MINMSIDFSPIAGMTEFIAAMAANLASEETRSTITQAMLEDTSSAFNQYADYEASLRPRNLFHVYETGMLGEPEGRLWRTFMVGAQSDKTLEFQWRAARKPNKVGKQAHSPIAGDTRQSVHIFVWKAPFLEEGGEISVGHSDTKKALAFPYAPGKGGMGFTNDVIEFQSARSTIGQFESIWEHFWRESVDGIIEQDFVLPTERLWAEEIPKVMLQLAGRKRKPIGFSVNLKPRVDMSGVAKGIQVRLNSGYVRAAHQREAISGSSSDI